MKPNVNIKVADTVQSIGTVVMMLVCSAIFAWWEHEHPTTATVEAACYTACGNRGGGVFPVDDPEGRVACLCYDPKAAP